MSARLQLESLLSSRGFGATLPRFDAPSASSIDDELRALLRDGPPPGAITELVPEEVGAPTQPSANLREPPSIARGALACPWLSSHGITSLALRLLARAQSEPGLRTQSEADAWAQTDAGEGPTASEPHSVPGHAPVSCVAWLDPDHALDVLSAEQAGITLERLLWVRSARRASEDVTRGLWPVARGGEIPRFLHAAQLLVHAGGFRVVAFDVRAQPLAALRLIPRSVWFRLLRAVERSRSALLVLAPAPLATTCSTLTVAVRRAAPDWRHDGAGLFAGMSIEARVIASRRLHLAGSTAKKPPAAVGLDLRLETANRSNE